MTHMSKMSGRHKAKTVKPLASTKHNLLKHVTKLAKAVNSKNVLDAHGIFATEKAIDVPRLKKVIARCRKIIALQSSILDEMEAEVKEIKQNARTKTPAKSQKRTTRRKA